MRLVAYIRVSEDEPNPSIEEQERRIAAYCEAFGHTLTRVYREKTRLEDTISPLYLEKVLKSLGRADGLIAMRVDRLYSATLDVLRLVELTLKPANKALVLLDPNVDTSGPYGFFTLTAISALTQLENNTRAVKVGEAVGTYDRNRKKKA